MLETPVAADQSGVRSHSMGTTERVGASFHPFCRVPPYSLVKAMNTWRMARGDEAFTSKGELMDIRVTEPREEREEKRHVERNRQQSDRGPLVHGILG